ncbi:MAG TPA: hemerythrin domain-containing protein [Stellaceae bacterium]|jgi:hemerythrin superfamily protein
MIREMLGIAEGILQDLHNDHSEVATLIDRIMETNDAGERDALFDEMKTKLLAHSKAEEEVFYRALENSANRESRNFVGEAANEHDTVERQLQKMSAGDKVTDTWTAELTRLRDLVEHHVDEEESTGFSCARDDFSKDELEAMAPRFQERKQELMLSIG